MLESSISKISNSFHVFFHLAFSFVINCWIFSKEKFLWVVAWNFSHLSYSLAIICSTLSFFHSSDKNVIQTFQFSVSKFAPSGIECSFVLKFSLQVPHLLLCINYSESFTFSNALFLFNWKVSKLINRGGFRGRHRRHVPPLPLFTFLAKLF